MGACRNTGNTGTYDDTIVTLTEDYVFQKQAWFRQPRKSSMQLPSKLAASVNSSRLDKPVAQNHQQPQTPIAPWHPL